MDFIDGLCIGGIITILYFMILDTVKEYKKIKKGKSGSAGRR